MAEVSVNDFLSLISAVEDAPQGRYLWSSYDSEADALYIHLKKHESWPRQ